MTYLIGNWKMNGSCSFTEAFVQDVAKAHNELSLAGNTHVVLCPPALHLQMALELLHDSAITIGAQDCHTQEKGAFTGNISAAMLHDIGCNYVIIGHSERRQYHGENDALIAEKLAAALAADITPVICIGESEAQRDAGDYLNILKDQLTPILDAFSSNDIPLIIAYEPIWAIGTGRVASLDAIDEACTFIHEFCTSNDHDAASVLYGGSVKADNARDILSINSVNGVLVGGASIDLTQWTAIMKAAT